MSLLRYALIVGTVVAASQAASSSALDEEAWRASALGATLAALNAVSAYALALWAEKRSTTAFFGAVLGGMLLRMGLLLLAFGVSISILEISEAPLAASLLGHFVAFLLLELVVLHKKTSVRAVEAR